MDWVVGRNGYVRSLCFLTLYVLLGIGGLNFKGQMGRSCGGRSEMGVVLLVLHIAIGFGKDARDCRSM